MKKLLLIISAILSLVALQAQTPVTDGYLTDGDIVSISVEIQENELNRYYLEASADGILTQSYATANCLWELGISENNGAYHYTLKDLTSDKYIYIDANPSNPTYSLQNTATTFTLDREDGEQGKYETGKLYYRFYHNPWNSWQTVYFAQGGWWPFRFTLSTGNIVTVHIEKWNKEGADTPGGGFYPETLIFPYASNDSEAQAQKQYVTFTIPETAVVSYQCINRPDEIIGGGQNDVDEGDITDFRLYWESSNTTTSEIKQSNYYTPNPSDGYVLPNEGTDVLTLTEGASAGTNKTHTFIITPIGKSPMNLRTNTNNRIQWVNYADRVVAEYKYKGNTVKQTMRVVRNSYHEEPLPPLTFHINPTMFTFGANAETVNITVVPIHQHGSVIYDVNHNVFRTEYEAHDPAYPEQLTLKTDGWVITTDDGADWLSHEVNTNSITITAEALGSGQSDRTATFTGTFKREKADGKGHDHEESFTIQLAQRSDAGIQFNKKDQEVHTATRTIYYLPEDRIELRLAESNFFGYMRWYDYHTGKAPNYNFGNSDPTYDNYNYATTWYTTPRGANNQPFTPINTPASAATEGSEGRSWGLYAINHNHGGILNEGTENSNNTPVLNGWNYTYTKGQTYSTEQAKRAAGYHTIACDVSAYTDYVITKDDKTGLVNSITEPTLSYRQLFDLRPAGEIADKFAKLENDKYLEEYHYQAPAGKNILLTPQFKYKRGNDEYLSKLCYFYWNGENLERVTNATWTGDGQDNGEYLTVLGNAGETKTYTLTANDGAVRIAKFTVTFTDPQATGPSRTVLKSDYEMTNIYSRKAHINFNYTDESKKTTLDGFTYYNQPLNAAESTYGFVYTQGALAETTNNSHHGFVRAANQGVFPFYGEYVLVNGVDKSWNDARVSAENHGGKDKGFALYVDGTTEPGLVVSISAEANICSGQTMYCSAWLCNPSNTAHQGSNPIFRFNVQGRKEGQTEWEDAGVFFVGELPKGSGWQQVVFPIESAHSYDETRVSLYNFATSGAANDFLVDDISLFVSQLPIAAYQGKMACRSVDSKTSAAAVLRLDYSNIQAGSDGYIYYQIFNTDLKKAVNLTSDEAYYHEAHQGEHTDDDSYGSVHIPATNYNPEENGETVYHSVSAFLDDLVSRKEKHGKAYVQTTNDGVTKWLLYVVHIIDNVTKEDMNALDTDDKKKALALSKLYDAHEYTMRMAYSPLELPQAACNMQTALHATQQTVFELRNSDGEKIKHALNEGTSELVANQGDVTNIYTNSVQNCANDLYFLKAKVVNYLAVNTGLTPENVEAPIYADWLVCPAELDAIFEDATKSQSEKEEAFYNYYGFRLGEVASAVMYDMRRKDNNTKNYNATSFTELDPSQFLNRENYNIVKHLHDNGWLQFRKTTIHFYLPSAMVASYWCFPIEGTAKTTIKDENEVPTEVTLKDCNEPRRIRVTSAHSDHMLNIAPMTNENKTSIQKTQIPLVKVLANQLTTVKIPITESANIRGVSSGKITINLEEGMGTSGSFYDLTTGNAINTKPTLSPGTEHTFRLMMLDQDSHSHIGGSTEGGCRVGYVFATIQILPNTLVWTPTESSFNGWGKDENWKGWVDKDKDNVIDKTDDPTTNELCKGYVPISGADVIIPKLDNTILYPYIVPEHEHSHYPMTVGFQPHHCKNIYFEPGAKIHNQHLLQYEKAFVDMQFPAAKWHLVSAPLQGMVSGDMFVPHNGWYDEKQDKRVAEPNPFEVKAFKGKDYTGIRSGDAAYAFWQAFYNTTTEGNTLLRNLADLQFTQSNTLVQPLTEGTGYAVYGLGFDENDSLTVRLPKPDTQYDYYTNGAPNGSKETIPTNKDRGRFAYTATHDNKQMTITLTNNTASEYFLFGNPTMAFVDMHALYLDNKSQWSGVFKTMQSNSINATTPSTMTHENRYLPPMTSALLKASSKAATEMTITLLPAHLTLNNAINPVDEVKEGGNETQQAPARRTKDIDERPVNHEALQSELMTIYAFTPKGTARTVLATNPVANDYYTSGEDALFTSSGVENESYVTTPLNMYTVAEQVPMMADVRQGISDIPLAILAADKARAEHMQLAFYLSANWSRECYFCDSKTGQKIRIMDGLVITVEMPQNHEQRYFIEGPDEYLGSSEDPQGPTTAVDNTSSSALATLQAFSLAQGELTIGSNQLIQEIRLYDLAGRLILDNSLTLLHTTTTVTAPSGICLVEAVLRDGTTLHTQALVK